MSYKEKPILKLYKYENNTFVLQAIIDDYMECSFERNLYQAGNFTISINYNIPNAQLFQRGLFVQFGNDPYDFGEIISISDAISSDGKGSQIRTITGYDSRYILKRRVIKNMNSNGLWVMTGKGEIVLRNLINDQCGAGESETKRQLPIINNIPAVADAIGKEYSASEQFTNLYEVCKTIATQSEIGWRLKFDNSSLTLTLECYEGENRAQTVQFSTSFDSLANGQFTDSSDSYSNAVYVGGKGQNDDRDIYEGEDGAPEGLDRYESWDNQSNMMTEDEYEAEALAMLTQYGQTITVSGNGLAKSPYVYKEEYDVGDIITLAFSGKSAVVQILNVTEHWSWGNYNINFSFGKPQNNLADQLQLMLRKIQTASEKTESTDSVRWYTIPDDTEMPKADVTYRTIGFIGNVGNGATFKLYLDNEKTGSKTYHVYFKQLAGAGKLTLTTGKEGASNLILNSGTYVAIVYVDENGNISSQGMTATNTVEAGNNQPVTSDAVNSAISGAVSGFVTGVKGNSEADYRTGNVNITKANIGLGNVDNTSDADKPVSTAQSTAISTAEANAKNLANATGTLAIAHGGTGTTSQANINTNFIANLSEGISDVTDGTMFVSSYASDNGFSDTNAVNKPYKRKFSHVWNYIKGKIGTAFGLQATKTDNAVARWDGTDGKLQNSGVTIDDNADMTVNNVHIGKGKSIYADGTKANTAIIKMKDNTSDAYGNGIVIGGGGAVVIGAGESADTYYSGASLTPGDESTRITADGSIVFASNLNSNYASRKEMTMGTDGKLTNSNGFVGYLTGDISGSSTSSNTAKSLCDTVDISEAGSTVAKTASLPGFVLKKGSKLLVNLVNANTVASATLNVNGTGAKTVYINGGNAVTTSNWTAGIWYAVYDGTNWRLDSSRDAYYARNADFASSSDYTRGNAYCTTGSGTQAKTASMRGYVLATGGCFPITFTNANSYNGKITLNVNSMGAKDIWINGAVSSSSNKTLPAGTYLCRYSGSYFEIDTKYAVTRARESHFAQTAETADKATTAYRIRTSAPSSPEVGDIWIS